jgi:hypothetical protein
VAPFCRHFLRCGGCHVQHLVPGARRRAKRALLRLALERALGRDVDVREPAPGPERGYREQIVLTLAPRPDPILAVPNARGLELGSGLLPRRTADDGNAPGDGTRPGASRLLPPRAAGDGNAQATGDHGPPRRHIPRRGDGLPHDATAGNESVLSQERRPRPAPGGCTR